VVGEYGGVHGIRLRGFRVGVCRRDRLCSLVTGQVSDRRLILVIRRPPRDPGPVMVPGGPAIGAVRPVDAGLGGAPGMTLPAAPWPRSWGWCTSRGPSPLPMPGGRGCWPQITGTRWQPLTSMAI